MPGCLWLTECMAADYRFIVKDSFNGCFMSTHLDYVLLKLDCQIPFRCIFKTKTLSFTRSHRTDFPEVSAAIRMAWDSAYSF